MVTREHFHNLLQNKFTKENFIQDMGFVIWSFNCVSCLGGAFIEPTNKTRACQPSPLGKNSYYIKYSNEG